MLIIQPNGKAIECKYISRDMNSFTRSKLVFCLDILGREQRAGSPRF